MSSIWFNNVEILFNKDNFTEIVPTKEMAFEQKINAITRFSLYLSILLYLVTSNYLYIYIFVITVIVFYLVYVFGGKEMFQGFIANYTTSASNNPSTSTSASNNPSTSTSASHSPSTSATASHSLSTSASTSNVPSTSATETTTASTISNIPIVNSTGPSLVRAPCKEPTVDNPLMNLLATDNYHKSLPACLNSEKDIQSKIDNNFKENLYLDTNTIYNNRTNQRSFYTMPNTKPANDQTAFAKWLYHIPISCEESKSGKLTLHRACSYTQKSLDELQKEL